MTWVTTASSLCTIPTAIISPGADYDYYAWCVDSGGNVNSDFSGIRRSYGVFGSCATLSLSEHLLRLRLSGLPGWRRLLQRQRCVHFLRPAVLSALRILDIHMVQALLNNMEIHIVVLLVHWFPTVKKILSGCL